MQQRKRFLIIIAVVFFIGIITVFFLLSRHAEKKSKQAANNVSANEQSGLIPSLSPSSTLYADNQIQIIYPEKYRVYSEQILNNGYKWTVLPEENNGTLFPVIAVIKYPLQDKSQADNMQAIYKKIGTVTYEMEIFQGKQVQVMVAKIPGKTYETGNPAKKDVIMKTFQIQTTRGLYTLEYGYFVDDSEVEESLKASLLSVVLK